MILLVRNLVHCQLEDESKLVISMNLPWPGADERCKIDVSTQDIAFNNPLEPRREIYMENVILPCEP